MVAVSSPGSAVACVLERAEQKQALINVLLANGLVTGKLFHSDLLNLPLPGLNLCSFNPCLGPGIGVEWGG
jgi:hypothetical protein